MLLQRDASNPKQDVPEPTTQAKKKAAKAKLRGDDAFRRQDYSMALDAYKQAIDFDPTNATLLSNRSICWIRMGQAEHALADAKACRALKPDWPKACYREGHALQLLEKFEEAAGAFYEGLMRDPQNKDILHAFREVAEALEKRKVALAVDNGKLL
jgi:tetratricopeptide (TPR) repeat protein